MGLFPAEGGSPGVGAETSLARRCGQAAGRGEVPLRVLLGQGEAATVVGKLGANVARLRRESVGW